MPEETALTERPEHGLALPSDGVGMSGEFDRDDVLLPTCTLVQPTSKSTKGEQGKFCFQDGQMLDEMQIVVLRIAATRSLWEDMATGGTGEGPVCRSDDRKVGYTERPSLVLDDATETDEPKYI